MKLKNKIKLIIIVVNTITPCKYFSFVYNIIVIVM